ncbi:hypothetical protein V2J56_09335 [Georgenia sp. MJ206]|uniref:hypothetical protein n=1 Tax=Georgenia wangjunii TaxID=3117730 RepID=UPI002F26020F
MGSPREVPGSLARELAEVTAARDYINTLRTMHPDAFVLRSLERQERELAEREDHARRAIDHKAQQYA